MKTNEDLTGKVCLITGATEGHGKACAKLLAQMGAHIIILGRNRKKCVSVQTEIAKTTNTNPEVLICDLSSKKEIGHAAEEFLSRQKPLHILINNAGIVNKERKVTGDGIEETFAVNYLSLFYLTWLLLDRIKESAPSRIINVSSDMHRMGRLDLNNLQLTKGYSWIKAYSNSKLAIIYFTIELSKLLKNTGVTVNALDPGPIASNIAGNDKSAITRMASYVIKKTFPKPERAARTAIYLATSSEIEAVSGRYYRFMKQKEPYLKNGNPSLGKNLWDLSIELTLSE
ncbi:SDR family oxidoreductase [Spirochaetota bacterium]